MKNLLLVSLLSFIIYFSALAQEDKMFWIDRTGSSLMIPSGDYMDEEYDGIALYREGYKYGSATSLGTVKVAARYDLAENLGHGFTAFSYTSDAWFIFNRNGKMIHGSPFKKIHSINGDEKPAFFNGLLPVQSISTGKIGCLDTAGQLVIPEIYDYIKDFGDPVLFIGKYGQHGLMNKNTKEEILTKYEKIKEFTQGLAAVSKKKKWGYINYEGKEVIPTNFLSVGYFFNGFAVVATEKPSLKKFINLKGDIIESTPYSLTTHVTQVYENVMFIKNENQKTALFDRNTGKPLTGFNFINDPLFVNDYAVCVDAGNIVILMSVTGKEIKGYDGYGIMNEGMVCAYKKETVTVSGKIIPIEKSGYIDTDGNIIIPFNFGGIGYFKNGIAKVVRFEDYKNYKMTSKEKK
jgi:hypothetical protein